MCRDYCSKETIRFEILAFLTVFAHSAQAELWCWRRQWEELWEVRTYTQREPGGSVSAPSTEGTPQASKGHAPGSGWHRLSVCFHRVRNHLQPSARHSACLSQETGNGCLMVCMHTYTHSNIYIQTRINHKKTFTNPHAGSKYQASKQCPQKEFGRWCWDHETNWGAVSYFYTLK